MGEVGVRCGVRPGTVGCGKAEQPVGRRAPNHWRYRGRVVDHGERPSGTGQFWGSYREYVLPKDAETFTGPVGMVRAVS